MSEQHEHDHEHEQQPQPQQQPEFDCCDVAAAKIIANAIDQHRNRMEPYLKSIVVYLDQLSRTIAATQQEQEKEGG